ncbi:MAG: AMP-binding protein [Gammaproteobacteria bacterium]
MSLPQYDWIAHHAEFTPNAIAQSDLHTGRRYTYAEMHGRVERLAAWLQRTAGVAAGDRIAVIAHNSTDVYEMFFAGMRAFVLTDAGVALTEKEVIDHCYANLARFKVPRSVRFVDELPHNATGKLVKHLLPRD